MVVVAPTGKASGTFRSAETAAMDFPNVDIRVVDTQTISCNLGSMVLLADDMAKAGKSADEIVAKLTGMIPCGRLYFVVDTLEYLARGGRIGGAKRLLAELLEIKPILQVKDGQVEPFEQQRTKKRALARLVEVAAEQCQGGEDCSFMCDPGRGGAGGAGSRPGIKVENSGFRNSHLSTASGDCCPCGAKNAGCRLFCRLTGMV